MRFFNFCLFVLFSFFFFLFFFFSFFPAAREFSPITVWQYLLREGKVAGMGLIYLPDGP